MTPEPSLRPAVRLNRLIPAAPGKVYRAWLEPELPSVSRSNEAPSSA